MNGKGYSAVDFKEIMPCECPCGMSRRAFINESGKRASFHIVEIKKDARRHYHKQHFEIYYILEGSGVIEVDDGKIDVRPGMSVFINELCRHRAVGNLKIANVSIPAFDPEDEWFD